MGGGWQALAGKLNNDGYPDVIALFNHSIISSDISWFEGTAQQTNLERTTLYSQEKRLNDWGIADMNNDGKVDLVACAYANQPFYNNEVVYIFLADGFENAYHPPVRIPSLLSNISLVDLDEDGDIDIVGSNDDENWTGWLENDDLNFTTHIVDASFYNNTSPATNYPARPVDVDDDGDLDILLFRQGAVAWRENLGNAQTWGPLTSLFQDAQASIYDVLPIDIDADNDLDFVASAYRRLIFIIKSNITDGYEYMARSLQADQIYYPRYVKADDIDGDGDEDLLFSTSEEELYWLENNGVDLTFPDLHLITGNFDVRTKTFYIEDLNNNGNKEILWSSDSQTKVLQNDGSGNFTTFFVIGSNYEHAIPFDTDQDGDLDLVFAKTESFSIRKNYANFSRIKGTVYWDENNNGQFDSLEMGLSQHQVLIAPASLLTWSAAQGIYEFAVEPNTYELSCIPADSWAMTTDSIVSITVPDSTMNIQAVDFGMRINTDTIIAQVHLASGATRCGFEVPFWINYHADSYKRTEGSIYLHLNPLAQFLSAVPMPSSVTDTLLTWNFSDLIPLETKTIALNFQIAGVEEIGNIIDMMAIMDITEADTIAARDTFLYRSIIACAYDPNDKQVSPSIPGYPNYTLFGEELMYTVRFENTGLDTAFNIFIEDQLDRDLDWTSFRLAGSSHPVRVTRSDANGCEQVGSVFLDLIVQTDTPTDEDAAFAIFPNPADHQLSVSSGPAQEVILSIYHLNGQLIKSEMVHIANKHVIDLKTLPSAVYLIKIFSQGKPIFIKRFTVVH